MFDDKHDYVLVLIMMMMNYVVELLYANDDDIDECMYDNEDENDDILLLNMCIVESYVHAS